MKVKNHFFDVWMRNLPLSMRSLCSLLEEFYRKFSNDFAKLDIQDLSLGQTDTAWLTYNSGISPVTLTYTHKGIQVYNNNI